MPLLLLLGGLPALPLPITETFSVDGSSWDASRWESFHTNTATATVSNGVGVLSTPSGTARMRSRMEPVANQGVLLKILGHSGTFTASLRMTSYSTSGTTPTDGLQIIQVTTSANLVDVSSGASTTLGSVGVPDVSVTRWLRFEVSGGVARWKMWADGAGEPGDWDIRRSFSESKPLGAMGIATTSDISVDDISIYALNPVAAATTDTSWGTQGRVVQTNATSWSAGARVTYVHQSTSSAPWVDADPWVDSEPWDAQGGVQWAVGAAATTTSVTATSDTSWAARQSITLTRATAYAVRTSVQKTSATSWGTRSRVVATNASSWGVLRPKFEEFTADFAGSDARFTLTGGAVVTGGELRLPFSWNEPGAYTTGYDYSLVGSAVHVQWRLPDVLDVSDALFFRLNPGTFYRMAYYHFDQTLTFTVYSAGGVKVYDGAVAVDDIRQHSWWRMREAAGVLYFETRPDSLTAWMALAQYSSAHLPPGGHGIAFNAYRDIDPDLATGYFAVDNINLTPATEPVTRASQSQWSVRTAVQTATATAWPTRQQVTLSQQSLWNVTQPVSTAQSATPVTWATRTSVAKTSASSWHILSVPGPKFETLVADFDSGTDVRFVLDAGATYTGGAVRLPANWDYPQIETVDRFDLRDSALHFEWAYSGEGFPDDGEVAVRFTSPSNSSQVGVAYYEGALRFSLRAHGVVLVGNHALTMAPDPIWRVREAGGTVYVDTRSDWGSPWVQRLAGAIQGDLGAMRLVGAAGRWNATTDQGFYFTFDNINYVPPQPVTAEVETSWSTLAGVADVEVTTWSVRTTVQSAHETVWGATEQVTLSAQALWNVTEPITSVELTQGSAWSATQTVELTRATVWRVGGLLVLTQGVAWSVGGQANAQAATTYDVEGYVARATLYLWKSGMEIPLRATRLRGGVETPIPLPVR